MAYINLGRVGYVHQGVYDPTTLYTKFDVVLYNNGSYVYWSNTDSLGNAPTDSAYWRVMLDPTNLNNAISEMAQLRADIDYIAMETGVVL